MQQFGFYAMGYRRERWYWESVVMLRKMAMVYIMIYVREPALQVYCASWLITVALVAQLLVRPQPEALIFNLEV